MNAASQPRSLRLLLGTFAGLLLASLVYAEAEPVSQAKKALALVGGEVRTLTDDGSFRGTILIRDDKIAAVGRDVAIPADAEKIDLTGFVITPGLIDARSSLWLTPAAVRDDASDGSLNILDGVDPHEEDWREVVRQGVTAVYVQPGATGLLGGRAAVLRVAPAQSVDELVIKADAAAQAVLGTTSGIRSTSAQPVAVRFGAGPADPTPTPVVATSSTGNALTRYRRYEQLKRTLEATKKYDAERTKQEAAAKAKKDKAASKTPAARTAKQDATQEFLRTVLKGNVPLRIEVHHEDDVDNALRLADEFRLRVVLDGVNNPRGAAESIKQRRIPLVLGPFLEEDELSNHARERPADWPRSLLTADSRWALGTFSEEPRGSRLLRVHAAQAVARGLTPESALRAITRNAAEILGVADRLGTIAVGKQADLAVFAADPLDPSVPVRLVLSAGKIVYEAKVAPVTLPTSAKALPALPERLPQKYVLKTERLLTEHGYAPGMVAIEKGRVVALGGSLAAEEGVPVYDLGAAVLTPGLVAATSDLGLSAAIDDPAEADAGQVRAADSYDPQHRPIRALLEGGFTSAVFVPGSANVIAGSCSAARLGAMEPIGGEAGVKFVLTAAARGGTASSAGVAEGPVLPTRRGGRTGPPRYPGSLAGQIELIDQVLSGKAPSSHLYVPSQVRRHLQSERQRALRALLERRSVAFFEAHTRAEVDAALHLIDRYQLRGALVGPAEIKPFLGEIQRLGVAIVAPPVQAADYDRPLHELADAAAQGVPVLFGNGPAQLLRAAAALAINAGMPREAAWRGLTSRVGLPDTAGQLRVGAPADLVVWSGLPLDLRSRPLLVLVDGKVKAAAP